MIYLVCVLLRWRNG